MGRPSGTERSEIGWLTRELAVDCGYTKSERHGVSLGIYWSGIIRYAMTEFGLKPLPYFPDAIRLCLQG